ncbi:MAG: glycosyltransferase family 39 protein [Cyanobacteria bacterium J06600_6]
MKFSNRQRSNLINLILLLFWLGLGLSIRFFHLDLKPPSSIEIATIGYSLGHGFNQIALDRSQDLNILLAPLHLDTSIGYSEVFNRLVEESTHPPLYFWLTRWWADIWRSDGDLVSLQVARSLSAVCGALAIPGMFTLGWVAVRSRWVAHLAALLMAFSPYGVYLAQEARHYTLTVLWIIASLICLVTVVKRIAQQQKVPVWLNLVWIAINGLGIATHYFFVLALGAEAIAVVCFWLGNDRRQLIRYIRGLSLASMGTLATALAWLPVVRGISGNEMTDWIATNYDLSDVLLPIPRLLTWMITMIMLLPVEGVSKPLAVVSGLVILGILIWVIPVLIRQGFRAIASFPTRQPTILFCGYLAGALAIFLMLIYGMGKDISLAARYHFVYFPVLILLVAIALANCHFKSLYPFGRTHNRIIAIVLSMAILGSLTIVNNLGFQKSLRTDDLADYIQNTGIDPTLIAMTHQTHSEIRELVALALSFERTGKAKTIELNPKFWLVSDNQYGQEQFHNQIKQIKQHSNRPLNLVGVNLDLSQELLVELQCSRDRTRNVPDSGYSDRFYLCQP